MPREQISTSGAPAAIGPYSQAIASGTLVFCSGQIPLDPASGQLVDGDVREQTRRAMENLRAGSRTVLFVSHNLAAVENLCKRCIWIDGGKVRMDGDSRRVIEVKVNTRFAAASRGKKGL